MATSNSFLNFGKKIYRTKPALLTPATYRPFLVNINSANEIKREQKKQAGRELRPRL
jgi:hypothetical protein